MVVGVETVVKFFKVCALISYCQWDVIVSWEFDVVGSENSAFSSKTNVNFADFLQNNNVSAQESCTFEKYQPR